MALNTYYVLTVVYSWSKTRLQRIKIYLYVIPAFCSVILALAGIPFYGALSIGCTILPYPYASSHRHMFLFTTVWVSIGTFYSTAAMVKIYFAVRKAERKSEKWRANQTNQQRLRRSRQVFYQGMFYLANFYLSWPTIAVGGMIAGYQNFEFWYVQKGPQP